MMIKNVYIILGIVHIVLGPGLACDIECDGGHCIPYYQLCDGIQNCNDNTDEAYCGTSPVLLVLSDHHLRKGDTFNLSYDHSYNDEFYCLTPFKNKTLFVVNNQPFGHWTQKKVKVSEILSAHPHGANVSCNSTPPAHHTIHPRRFAMKQSNEIKLRVQDVVKVEIKLSEESGKHLRKYLITQPTRDINQELDLKDGVFRACKNDKFKSNLKYFNDDIELELCEAIDINNVIKLSNNISKANGTFYISAIVAKETPSSSLLKACPPQYQVTENYCFQERRTPMTWKDAMESCIQIGVPVDSLPEEIIDNITLIREEVWLNARRMGVKNVYTSSPMGSQDITGSITNPTSEHSCVTHSPNSAGPTLASCQNKRATICYFPRHTTEAITSGAEHYYFHQSGSPFCDEGHLYSLYFNLTACVKIFDESMGWTDAKDKCDSINYQLPRIDSQEKQTFLRLILEYKREDLKFDSIWLAIEKIFTQTIWDYSQKEVQTEKWDDNKMRSYGKMNVDGSWRFQEKEEDGLKVLCIKYFSFNTRETQEIGFSPDFRIKVLGNDPYFSKTCYQSGELVREDDDINDGTYHCEIWVPGGRRLTTNTLTLYQHELWVVAKMKGKQELPEIKEFLREVLNGTETHFYDVRNFKQEEDEALVTYKLDVKTTESGSDDTAMLVLKALLEHPRYQVTMSVEAILSSQILQQMCPNTTQHPDPLLIQVIMLLVHTPVKCSSSELIREVSGFLEGHYCNYQQLDSVPAVEVDMPASYIKFIANLYYNIKIGVNKNNQSNQFLSLLKAMDEGFTVSLFRMNDTEINETEYETQKININSNQIKDTEITFHNHLISKVKIPHNVGENGTKINLVAILHKNMHFLPQEIDDNSAKKWILSLETQVEIKVKDNYTGNYSVGYECKVPTSVNVTCAALIDDKWFREGCSLERHDNDYACKCKQFGAVSLLFSPKDHIYDYKHLIWLNTLSLVGYLLSLAGLVFVLATYAMLEEIRKTIGGRIFVQYALSLLCFYFTSLIEYFLNDIRCGVKVSNTSTKGMCVHTTKCNSQCSWIAPLLHWFLLNSLFFLVLQGVYFYMLFAKQFRDIDMPKLLGFRAGLIISGIWGSCVLAFSKTGVYHSFTPFCWIEESYAFFLIHMPAIICLFVNFCIIMLCCRFIVCKATGSSSEKSRKQIPRFLLFYVLSLVINLVVSVLTMTHAVFGYLFCFFFSLQGMFMAFFVLFQNATARKMWRKKLQICRKAEDQETMPEQMELTYKNDDEN